MTMWPDDDEQDVPLSSAAIVTAASMEATERGWQWGFGCDECGDHLSVTFTTPVLLDSARCPECRCPVRCPVVGTVVCTDGRCPWCGGETWVTTTTHVVTAADLDDAVTRHRRRILERQAEVGLLGPV